jgi:hypothetical protein
MKNINELFPTNDPMSYWGNSVKDSIRESNLVYTSDFVGDSSPGGQTLELAFKYKYPQSVDTYTGEWDITSSYNVGDIVRVMPDNDYIWGDLDFMPSVAMDITTSPPSFASGYTTGQLLNIIYTAGSVYESVTALYVKPIPGVYRCISTIPSMFYIYDSVGVGTLPSVLNVPLNVSYLSSPPSINTNLLPFIGSTLRFWDVNYFPVWPELPNVASGSINSFNAFNGRYWDRIGGLPMGPQTIGICNNGVNKTSTIYIDGFTRPTGSYMNATGSFPNVP